MQQKTIAVRYYNNESLHELVFQSRTCVFSQDKKPWLRRKKKIILLEYKNIRQGKENEEKLKGMRVFRFDFNTKIIT